MSADGTVHPIYNGQSSISLYPFGSSGIQNAAYTVDHSVNNAFDLVHPVTTTHYYHADHLGSSRLVTSGYGYPVWGGTFLPYGQEWNPQIGPEHNKFTGLERDAESGLDHTWFRQYASVQGRWMTPDPAGLAAANPSNPQSWNRYAYVMNSPLGWTDPLGLGPNCEKYPNHPGCQLQGGDTKECFVNTIDGYLPCGLLGSSESSFPSMGPNGQPCYEARSGTVFCGEGEDRLNWQSWIAANDLFWQWATGTGESVRLYSQSSIEVQALRKSLGAQLMVQDNLKHHCPAGEPQTYLLDTLPAFILTAMSPGNGTAAQVGAWSGTYFNDRNTNVTTYIITNNVNLNSFLGHIFSSADKLIDPSRKWLQNNIGRYSTGPGRNIHQVFMWQEATQCN